MEHFSMTDCWKFFSLSKVNCSLVHFYLGFKALFYFAYPFKLLVYRSDQVCDLQENNVWQFWMQYLFSIDFGVTCLLFHSILLWHQFSLLIAEYLQKLSGLSLMNYFLSFYQLINFTLLLRKHHLVFYLCWNKSCYIVHRYVLILN